jgi:hypothetical protein
MTEGATAGSCPSLSDGGQRFGQISGPEDPEDYCFEVTLGEEQELRQIDDRHVQAFYSTGQPSFEITAEQASDVEGASVPTTLTMTGSNIVTLTVHHREGNPLANGAAFHYPVVGGSGWEGGFHTVEVKMSPPTEQAPVPPVEPPTPQCEVPVLQGRTVPAARRALLHAGCALGPIRGRRHSGARIVKQYRPAYKVLPAGTAVGVKLGR